MVQVQFYNICDPNVFSCTSPRLSGFLKKASLYKHNQYQGEGVTELVPNPFVINKITIKYVNILYYTYMLKSIPFKSMKKLIFVLQFHFVNLDIL